MVVGGALWAGVGSAERLAPARWRIDPLSTELTQAVATGQHFPEVVLSIPIGGPGQFGWANEG